ncbi:protein kinase domain-containing protein [Streptomyces chartreusis]|uniref:serine/threonine protein kinase n=1 Tax=Streptomyces chartreusis TaxID=1969 RepID=UPI0038674B5D|nr:protein kinase [Streptomyces chartreusis]WTA33766.1 protein kinase [Streptomyces chartreusis]
MHNQDANSPDAGGERLVAGRYRLLSMLGEGGMGTVWRAHDQVLHREVAVKEVRVSLDLPPERRKHMHVRLEREAWAAARVNARAVVTVYDVVTFDDRPWIVMELVRGRSLADVIGAEGALPPKEVARIGTEVLAALRAAHAAGVLHRDVKPANVLLADEGRVVLTDFGIATIEGDTALTMTGEVVGSPEYLAPERALGRTPGTASDLWSLGVLLYTTVQGRSPFHRTTALATLRAIVDDELPLAHRAGALGPVIEGLMIKNPEQRMTAEEAERQLHLAVGDVATPSEAETSTDVIAASATAPVTAGVTVAVPTAAEEVPPAAVTSMEATSTAVDANSTASVPQTVPAPLGTFGPPASGAGFGPVITELGAGFGHGTGLARRSRRTAYLIGAAAAVLVLLGGGLAYTLGTQGDHKNKDGGAGTGDSQPVSVAVTGRATRYDGVCPPGEGQAPWFMATFTTDRAPVQFSYRWVSENGPVVDQQWRTLSFREGDPPSKKETVRLSTYAQEGTLRSAMAVEIKSPFDAKSNAVAFSIICRPSGE